MATLLWFTAIGWLLTPVISFLVNKLLSYIDFNASRKLRELEIRIIPSLKLIIGDVKEQIIVIGAKDEGKGYASDSDLKTLGELGKDLKSALCNAEDVLDLIEYRQIEKKVIGGDGKSLGTMMIRNWVLQAIGNCIACCKRSSFVQKRCQCAQNQYQKLREFGEKLQQCAKDRDLQFWDLVAKLKQYAQNLNQMFWDFLAKLVQCAQSLPLYIHQGAAGKPSMPDAPSARSTEELSRDDIEQGSATTPSPTPGDDAPSNPPSPNALPNSAGSATEFRGDNQHGSADEPPTTLDVPLNSLLQNTWDCFGYAFSAILSVYLAVRHARDWSYEAVGIKNGDDDTATDISFNDRKSLRKTIEDIEHTLNESKKSHLLSQKSSSSEIPVKDTKKECSSRKKEINDYLIRHKVFGRDKEREDICKMLREGSDAQGPSSSSSKPYSVIGLHGIAGSGKSTLAQYVCDYEKTDGQHFDLAIFIQVSRTFNLHEILSNMLKEIASQPRSDSKESLDSLIHGLRKNLRGRRFLLVLDDLWVNEENRKPRDILLDALKSGKKGSRILVTARTKEAAAALHAQKQIQISDLEEEEYFSMFMHYALGEQSNDLYNEYTRAGRKIVEKLHKSPMAAAVVGKRLGMNQDTTLWNSIANLDVLNGAIGPLWWSYQQLGSDIKRCFEYCSIFPRGHKSERNTLVHMWIAQGFVKSSNTSNDLEDIGQCYFHELQTCLFLQVQRTDSGSEEFTIHDLLHELAERAAGVEFYGAGVNGLQNRIRPEVRHLFIETYNRAEIVDKILESENLRTLVIEEKYRYNEDTTFAYHYQHLAGIRIRPWEIEETHDLINEELFKFIFTRLIKLRVLIVKVKCNKNLVFSVPESIGEMKHLKLLGFRSTYSLELFFPSTLARLLQMQILDVPNFRLSSAEDMTNLIHLRHTSGALDFCSIGRFTSLRTLPTFRVGEGHELKQLKHLNSLQGNLTINGLENVESNEEALEAKLADKKELTSLSLAFSWNDFGCNPDVEAEVLEGLCPPRHLEELYISYYHGQNYPSWMVVGNERGPNHLYRLKLMRCSKLESIPEGSAFFSKLRCLCLTDCSWDALPGHMERLTSLQKLEIYGCQNIDILPKLPQSLEHIVLKRVGYHLRRSCKERGHENWKKIEGIGNKDIE